MMNSISEVPHYADFSIIVLLIFLNSKYFTVVPLYFHWPPAFHFSSEREK